MNDNPTEFRSSVQEMDEADIAVAREIGEKREAILREIQKVIVGQGNVLELVLISLLSKGHCLLVGVPGLAKTLLIRTMADVIRLEFNRIQFTPDLMPSDITGTDILDETTEGRRVFRFIRGPVFSQILLADEINRTPPKTQAALLQAMQEQKVTAGGQTHDLEPPFFVLATQNPVEQEGTYPLPEAQLDRFMFEIRVDYPSLAEESEIVAQTTSDYVPVLDEIIGAEQILAYQDLVRRVPAAPYVVDYAVSLARASRPSCKPVSDSRRTGEGAFERALRGVHRGCPRTGRAGASPPDFGEFPGAGRGHGYGRPREKASR
jgi:MoxR-like ATPase